MNKCVKGRTNTEGKKKEIKDKGRKGTSQTDRVKLAKQILSPRRVVGFIMVEAQKRFCGRPVPGTIEGEDRPSAP